MKKNNTEIYQKMLELFWALQNNESNAVSWPRRLAEEILGEKVLRHAILKDGEFYGWKYFLGCEKNKPEGEFNLQREYKKGGRPKILTKEDCQKVIYLHSQGLSNCEIGRRLKVSEKTVRRTLQGS